MRGTLHFVAADDARWITRLLAPRVIARNSARWKRDFDVDAKRLARADEIISGALAGGKRLSRERLYDALETKRIRTGQSRGLHLLLVLAMQGRLCLAGRDGKQHTFALLDEWVPDRRHLEGDDALAELALRYFTSHGPATLKDFIWWAGVTAKQAAVAIDGARGRLTSVEVGARYWWRETGKGKAARRATAPDVRLLPAFDEYTVAYHDRSLLVEGAGISKMALLNPAVVVDGRVVGSWKRSLEKRSVIVTTTLARKLTRTEDSGLREAANSYGEFLALEMRMPGG
jgi:hypothetical protein